MEKIKLKIAGIPAVLYGKRSRKVYLYVHGKNGSAAEAARFARTACPTGWQVLAVDLPEHGTRKNSPEKLVPWVVTRELQTVYARMQPVWKHIRVYGLALVAVDWGLRQKTITPLFGRMAVKLCATLPDKLRLILKSGSELDALAAYLTGYDRLLFVGQNIDLAAAGAMAGVWSRTLGVPVETVPAAELRHTLLPTVDSHTALVALISSRELTEKTCAALQLAAIRGAGTVACTVESLAGQLSGARQVFLFPDSLPLLAPVCQCATLSMLLLRLCTAREQAGRPVEQPPVLPRYFAG